MPLEDSGRNVMRVYFGGLRGFQSARRFMSAWLGYRMECIR